MVDPPIRSDYTPATLGEPPSLGNYSFWEEDTLRSQAMQCDGGREGTWL